MVRDEALSVFLGYLSIASWLGAQFPQVILNWKRRSVDGLALPFLINWLIGDSTNLIGCLLTDQLPFQTFLATYFVFVDACLVSQYLYYDASRDAKKLSKLTTARQSRASLNTPTLSQSPETYFGQRSLRSRSRSFSVEPEVRAAVTTMALAADVPPENFGSASEVGYHGTHGRRRQRTLQRASSLEGLPESIVAEPRDHHWGGRQQASDEEGSDGTPSAMFDSFHSEGGGGRGRGKHVSWTRDSISRERVLRRLSQDAASRDEQDEGVRGSSTSSTVRGRPLTRSALESGIEENVPTRERRLSTASIVSAGASRRSASIVFLGVFALFTFSSRLSYYRYGTPSQGVVLTAQPTPRALAQSVIHSFEPLQSVSSSSSAENDHSQPSVLVHLSDSEPYFLSSTSGQDTQMVIGRISAWTCTTLYLTSRLPQIWKNYVRKSVEGLSVYLFIFAFMGNLFYVLSILSSPKLDQEPPLARQFLRESIPYLLGSGGTLCFDVTIVVQSFIYAPNRRLFRSRARRKSLTRVHDEEERGLLAGGREEER